MSRIISLKCFLILILLSIFNPISFNAHGQDYAIDPLNQWHLRNPSGLNFLAVAYGNGIYVAVGDAGAIMTSPDGINWIRQNAGTGQQLHGVTYGNGTFVAVGGQKDNYGYITSIIISSTNGINWTQRGHNGTYFLLGVSYINGTFMAVGSSGAIRTSPDGINWSLVNSGTNKDLSGCAYGNGKYVAVGQSGTIRSSVDTVNWTGMTYGTGWYLRSVTYGNSNFVAVGFISGVSGGRILSSSDGNDWFARQVPSGVYPLKSVLYASELFIAVGNTGSITTSSDGITWDKQVAGSVRNFKGITNGSGLLIAVGGEIIGDPNETLYGPTIQTSTNGTQWKERVSGTTDWLETVTYGNGMFVAAGTEVVTSPNGINWTLRRSESESFRGSAFGNGIFVLVGSDRRTGETRILTSDDGINWIVRVTGYSYPYLYDVTFGNGLFVAVGETGVLTSTVIITSPDGITWTERYSGTTEQFKGVSYGNGIFVAVGQWDGYYGGYYGSIITSHDGVNWTRRISRINESLEGIAYGNGTFVALGKAGGASPAIKSSDGINWSGASFTWAGPNIAFGKDTFVAVGVAYAVGQQIYSYNDIDNKWTQRPQPTTCYLDGVTFGDGTFVAVGSTGCIIQSGNINNSQIQVTPSTLNFGYVPPGSYKDSILTVKNIGGMTLTGTVSVSTCPNFSIVSGGSYSLGAGESQQVIVRYTAPFPLQEGSQTCSLTFTGGGGITIQVKGTNKIVSLPWLQLLLGN